MSEQDIQRASLLARVNFPIYCIKSISERHILIGGGGGMAKTGISNPFEIYELTYDPVTNTARATLATHFDVGANAIMNMCVIPSSKYLFELACGGMQGMCHIYDVKFRFKNGLTTNHHDDHSNDQNNSSSNYLRRRHMSLSSQNSIEDIEENIEEYHGPTVEIKNKLKTDSDIHHNDNQDGDKKNSVPNTIPDYIFDFDLKESFQTDFHSDEPYQKLIKYSLNANMVFSAGADGHIGFWQLPNYKLLTRLKAHENEIDDIDIHPSGRHLASVSRDGRSLIWNINNYKLVTSLEHSQVIPKPTNKEKLSIFTNAKYLPRLCRYSIVEGDENNVRLFVALNSRAKLDSYICKWTIQKDQYYMQKIISAGDVPLFAMAISDDGRFLAVGKQTGDIDVFIAFSLQRCYQFSQAHNIFVTGIEFLSTTQASLELVGGDVDAALVSVSVDNRIVLHKIPKRGFFGSFLFFVLFILFIYVTMNYFDL
ncbi:guanine nucleotide-exchange factor SEC12 isoform X2 [Dermatophagoides farinae]|uniref:guanine nucleotide-exchange factor SEC12 isoform X2 n=1 Tax=Dermatophagoides farinae TaxID=6954 RepID=UPI003F5EE25F